MASLEAKKKEALDAMQAELERLVAEHEAELLKQKQEN